MAVVKSTRIGGREFCWGKRTYVMGIINVTPDSFSGDGVLDPDEAVRRAVHMEEDGADIIDVGGESTRPPSIYPGAKPISAEEEMRRVLPVLERMAKAIKVPISIDTYKYEVAKRALDYGASMINDVWGLRKDIRMAGLAAERNVPIILMHNQQKPEYKELISDVIEGLRWSISQALAAGVSEENIIIDPGIGFGKTAEHSIEVIRRLVEFRTLGYPILIGPSRKSFIGYVLDLPVDQRVEGTAAVVALAVAGGADIVRVHDVRQMVRVCRMADAIVRGL